MKSFVALFGKEWMEQVRAGRVTLLGICFFLLGIMNPAVAKMTPWLLEMMAESLAESGMSVTEVTVDVMTSWVQFFKNIPMGLILFLVLESSLFTKEVQSGTLILSLARGVPRSAVVWSKTGILLLLWSACFWMCYGVTYGYNEYFWGNESVVGEGFSAVCWWIFGLWCVTLLIFFSSLSKTNTAVLVGCGGMVLLAYLLTLFRASKDYTPVKLVEGVGMMSAELKCAEYWSAIGICLGLSVLCLAVSVPIWNRKQL